MSKNGNLLIKAAVASVITLIVTYSYWTTQPNLEVSTLPVASTTSYPGAYIKAKMPTVKLEQYQ
jgi:hypothetical protein